MAVFQSEDRSRLRRVRSEKAIQLAMQNRWQEAIELNRQILEAFPKDVDTHNRLGKALMELGHYGEARDAYREAAGLDPSNTIATKNLARLSKLVEEEASDVATVPPPTPVDPRLFIEESGKTAMTTLVDVAPFESIAALTAGDTVDLQVDGGVVRVVSATGQIVGQIEPKLAQRILKLVEIGNKYGAAITSIDETHVRIIVREAYRHPSMGARPSFPTQTPEIRPYTKDSVFRTDPDEDDDDLAYETEPDAEAADAVDAAEGTLDDTTVDDPDLAEDR